MYEIVMIWQERRMMRGWSDKNAARRGVLSGKSETRASWDRVTRAMGDAAFFRDDAISAAVSSRNRQNPRWA